MMLIDLDGSIVADLREDRSNESVFPFHRMLHEADANGQAVSIVVLNNTILQFVLVPIRAPDPIGWIGIGVEVDDIEAARLQAQSTIPLEMTFAFLSDHHGWSTAATTLAEKWVPSLPAIFTEAHVARDNKGELELLPNVPLGDDTFTTLVEVIATSDGSLAVGVALQRSVRAAMDPHRPLFVALIAVVIVGFLFTALVALIIARGVTRPLRILDSVAKQVRAGDYPEPISEDGADEISHLSMTFNDMVKEMSERQRRIDYQANFDDITTLPNRNQFENRLISAIDSNNLPRPMALLLINLENFFEINNTLGHQAGDKLIADAAKRIRNCLKNDDVLARFGHDKFAVLVEHKGDHMIELIADRINMAFEAPFAISKVNVDVIIRIGVSCYPEHGSDYRTLLRRVEIAIESAHTSARGYEVYDRAKDPYTSERLSLMSDLRDGIENDELRVNYQPKVTLPGEIVTQVEALVRWHHPEQGELSPDDFIAVAERTGHVRNLTRWVLKQAIADCSRWHKMGQQMRVGVNVSAVDLTDTGLAPFIMQELIAHDLSTSAIVLEVTESAVMERPEVAIGLLRRLSAMGLHIAIDDFGTGQSSMAYVKRLPATELKIDRSFITDLVHNRNDEIIVRSTIELAHNLGMKVTAEGV